MKHILVYLSPNGGTEKVVDRVENDLKNLSAPVQKQDLYRRGDYESIIENINKDDEKCVWFFTPVYVDHPLPQIVEIIQKIEKNNKTYAVIVASWGGVSSGLALYDLYELLNEKNIRVLGACKVLSEHSSMWKAEEPLNISKPDGKDLTLVSKFTQQITEKIESKTDRFGLDLQDMDYQTDKMKKEAGEKNLELAKTFLPPKIADENLCTKCGKCIDICPVFALRFNPYPKAMENCIMCNNCVKICPEGAYPYDHEATEKRIKEMAIKSDEPKTTELFV